MKDGAGLVLGGAGIAVMVMIGSVYAVLVRNLPMAGGIAGFVLGLLILAGTAVIASTRTVLGPSGIVVWSAISQVKVPWPATRAGLLIEKHVPHPSKREEEPFRVTLAVARKGGIPVGLHGLEWSGDNLEFIALHASAHADRIWEWACARGYAGGVPQG